LKIDGQCHCGRVRYTATIDPNNVSVCHCTDCQAISGSAYRTTLRVLEADFEMTGTVKTYQKVAASGNLRNLVFCPECGTQMYGVLAEGGPKIISIRLGTTNQRAQLPPKRQIWGHSAMPWIHDLEGVLMSLEQD
jgi:hypothetical protein